MTSYSERIERAQYDIHNALVRGDLDIERFVAEEAELLTPGGTYETLLVAAEMFQAGDISIPWELTSKLQVRICQGMRHRLRLFSLRALESSLED